jgi:hypothetical protein
VNAPARGAVVLFVAVAVACSACGGTTAGSKGSTVSSSTRGTGKLDPAVAMPSAFPADFPVYPGARLTQASEVTNNGQTTWGMQWETLDGVDAVQGFYVRRLNSGDWTISYNGSSGGNFSAIFSRRSNQKDAGILAVELESDVTRITLAFGVNG